MLTIKLDIANESIDLALEDIEEFYGVVLTRKQFASFLKRHPKLAIDVLEEDFDTVCREDFADHLAFELTGLSWPSYADSEKVKKKFEKAFVKAAEKAKIKLEDDWSCGGEKW